MKKKHDYMTYDDPEIQMIAFQTRINQQELNRVNTTQRTYEDLGETYFTFHQSAPRIQRRMQNVETLVGFAMTPYHTDSQTSTNYVLPGIIMGATILALQITSWTIHGIERRRFKKFIDEENKLHALKDCLKRQYQM